MWRRRLTPGYFRMKIDSRKTSLTDFIRVESSDLFEKTNQFRHFADDMRERDLEKYLLRRMSRAGSRAVTLDERTGNPNGSGLLLG